MHGNQICVAILATTIAAFGTLSAANAAPAPACAKITSACEAAGFVRGGARTGNGLHRHCVAPIMRGTLTSQRASKPLPHVAASLVADCKTQRGATRKFPGEARERVMQMAQRFIGRLRD
jgi:hypothetical protein